MIYSTEIVKKALAFGEVILNGKQKKMLSPSMLQCNKMNFDIIFRGQV